MAEIILEISSTFAGRADQSSFGTCIIRHHRRNRTLRRTKTISLEKRRTVSKISVACGLPSTRDEANSKPTRRPAAAQLGRGWLQSATTPEVHIVAGRSLANPHQRYLIRPEHSSAPHRHPRFARQNAALTRRAASQGLELPGCLR